MTYWVGIDTGGTFTDTVVVDRQSGRVRVVKVPSVPAQPDRAIMEALDSSGIPFGSITRFVHGTTVSTNTVIERKGAKVGLITNEGFEDVLEIQRTDRGHLYDLQWDKPSPLVPRRLRLGVRGRLDYEGKVVEALDELSVERAVRALRDEGAEAIAICLLFSYVNPEHERTIRSIVEKLWPDAYTSISSDVINEFREYERTSTAVIDAYVKPRMASYLETLGTKLESKGIPASVNIMKSSGGAMTVEDCREQPIQTLLSGPAGGVVGASYFGRAAGFDDLITFDMGGTSADVSLVVEGEPQYTTEQEIEWGVPAKVPALDIRTIGAGGGSVAWIDKGGRLKVGPRSAGADPGPACYARGNPEPTVTDANIVLGYLNPDYFLGGEMTLDASLAERAIEERIAKPLGVDTLDAARGIVDIANANMTNLIRQASVQRGHDPRGFALVAFGGSGPVHAGAVARALGIKRVVVPPSAGVLSAFGFLLADLRYDFVQSFLRQIDSIGSDELVDVLKELEVRGRALVSRAGQEDEPIVERHLDVRYARQNHSVLTRIPEGFYETRSLEVLKEAFATEYERLYGYRMQNEPIEIVNCRVTVVGETSAPPAPTSGITAGNEEDETGTRPVDFGKHARTSACPVLRRTGLPPGENLPSPCIVEQVDSTIVVGPDEVGVVDAHDNVVISINGENT